MAIGIKHTLTGLQEVVAALSQIDIGNRDTTPMMDEIGAAMVASTQLRFEDERDPDGNPWPPSIRAFKRSLAAPQVTPADWPFALCRNTLCVRTSTTA